MTEDFVRFLAMTLMDAGSQWLPWAIGVGVIALSGAFAYIGRLAMRPVPVASSRSANESEVATVNETEMDPADARAFAALARRARLSKAQRHAVRRLAGTSRTPAPALFISEHAFDTAVSSLENTSADGTMLETLAVVRSRLFAE